MPFLETMLAIYKISCLMITNTQVLQQSRIGQGFFSVIVWLMMIKEFARPYQVLIVHCQVDTLSILNELVIVIVRYGWHEATMEIRI